MKEGPHAPVCLWIDGSARIVAVNAAWDRFAEENEGESATRDHVVGTDLFGWIRGDETRMMLIALLQFVRLTGESVTREYRCDTAELRRFMRMVVRREEAGLIRFDHELLRTERMSVPVRFRGRQDSDHAAVRRCSFCNRVEIKNAWWNGDEAARDGRLRSSGSVVTVRYVVCPLCAHEHGVRSPIVSRQRRTRR